jgi:dTDP-4-amino-4,6-dideoxygalactose transaminase
MTGRELFFIADAHFRLQLSGGGYFTEQCQGWLEEQTGCGKALLTHSCTAALEMAAILIDTGLGDEIIMPSYTFVSTANAFVLRGGIPVFVDIRPDTKNIDESLIEAAITPKTKAIVVVHYAGVGCEMDAIMDIAKRHDLFVIEDAAQGIMSTYHNKSLGSIGHLATLSFHETKNITCGEGGALLINDPSFIERAEIIWEKGTNRKQFYRNQVDKYTWVDMGSSYLPGEISAAFLWAQCLEAKDITESRLEVWDWYYRACGDVLCDRDIRVPIIPEGCSHNAHMFYLTLKDRKTRDTLLDDLAKEGISAVFHYVPLHQSLAGERFTRTHGTMKCTEHVGDSLIRLPLWIGMTHDDVMRVIKTIVQCESVKKVRSSGTAESIQEADSG